MKGEIRIDAFPFSRLQTRSRSRLENTISLTNLVNIYYAQVADAENGF